ncbi:uncharacterized protein LOC130804996 isoform X2 [Amaranthus tricolor]|uniref:uncharacterized protein LOC130804996 isoform X2 n=1 Tax=Amaranthus tricolor TaxID=29722 RepID=UPI002588A099|nr:uncharacterized protein LOC130804996 isoform X2 [Amaranthus tricolor]
MLMCACVFIELFIVVKNVCSLFICARIAMAENRAPRHESHETREESKNSHDSERTVTSHEASHAQSDHTETSIPVVPAAITVEQFETMLKMFHTQQQQNLLLQQQVLQSVNTGSSKGNSGHDLAASQAEGIQRLAPKTYDGKGPPTKLDDWIRGMEKIFAILKTPEDMRVDLAVHYLTGDADTWWVTHRDALLPAPSADTSEHPSIVPSLPWSLFVSALRDEFFPLHLQRRMFDEYSRLTQGTQTVHQYYVRFMELAKYVDDMKIGERFRAQRFLSGLSLDIRERMRSLGHEHVPNVYHDACEAKRLWDERKITQGLKRRREDTHEISQSIGGRRFLAPTQLHREPRSSFGRSTLSTPQSSRNIECYHCGKKGHKRIDCYKYIREQGLRGTLQGSARKPVGSQASVTQDRRQGRPQASFGHGPHSQGSAMGSSSRPSVGTPVSGTKAIGKLMTLKRDEAEVTPGVVTGDDVIEEPF